ncbi:hypothetical protein ASF09_19120 [Sphingomonas sp. Leaf242]|nr:hypothetical protein ASF09_19120 [Sphingomonas sp. Leaf242]
MPVANHTAGEYSGLYMDNVVKHHKSINITKCYLVTEFDKRTWNVKVINRFILIRLDSEDEYFHNKLP